MQGHPHEPRPARRAARHGDAAPSRRWWTWWWRGTGGLLAAIAIVATVAMVRADPPAPPTTTTSSTTTTTTAVPIRVIDAPEVLPIGTSAIATANEALTEVTVRAAPPAGWDTTPPVLVHEPSDAPPRSGDALPARPALPRPDYPLTGRTATAEGWTFTNPGPYEPPQPFTMSVVEQRGEWIEVRLPVRPNGTHGWVHASEVTLSRTTQRIEIRLGERRLIAHDGDRVVVDTPVVIGAQTTPTPTGTFYVTDLVPQANPGGSYGPVVLATNGYSETMDYFATGVPVIAVHGTNRPQLVGSAVSNGCVRVPNEFIEELAAMTVLGAPVTIWP